MLGATYARFLFAAPLAAAFTAALIGAGGAAPVPTSAFVGWALLGGAGQITAQLLLLQLFTLRNFAVGNTFARTETVQSAILGAVLLGDWLTPLATAAILISAAGIVLLSVTSGWRGGLWSRATAIGIASGAAFAVSAVSYRAASLSLAGEAGFLLRAAFTLAFVTLAQTLAMSLWMRLRRPGAIAAVLRHWRAAASIGAVGMLASLGWFTAFTLTSAAEVKAVGQIELLFSFLTARFAFGERPTPRETAGIVLVAGGIVLLVTTA